MKTLARLFFLSLLTLAFTAQAQTLPSLTDTEYQIKQVASNLGNAAAFTFDFEGHFIVAQNQGSFFRIVKTGPGIEDTILLERSLQPILNLGFYKGLVYAVTRGKIQKLARGKLADVINGLPAYGDYGMGPLAFSDNQIYFSVGTATNSGIIGSDNSWLANYPGIHDLPCNEIKLTGVNAETLNFLTKKKDDKALTGSFMPFNTSTPENGIIAGSAKCNGAIFRIDTDGYDFGVLAWGFHNPKSISFGPNGNLIVLDQGMEDRGARPVKNGKDSLFEMRNGSWYGWPDFSAGVTVEPPLLTTLPGNPPEPNKVFELNALKSLIAAPKEFMDKTFIGLTSDNRIVKLGFNSKESDEFINFPDKNSPKVVQFKFGPDDKLYILASQDGKNSSIYEVDYPVHTSMTTASKAKNLSFLWPLNGALMLGGLITIFLTRSNKSRFRPLQKL